MSASKGNGTRGWANLENYDWPEQVMAALCPLRTNSQKLEDYTISEKVDIPSFFDDVESKGSIRDLRIESQISVEAKYIDLNRICTSWCPLAIGRLLVPKFYKNLDNFLLYESHRNLKNSSFKVVNNLSRGLAIVSMLGIGIYIDYY